MVKLFQLDRFYVSHREGLDQIRGLAILYVLAVHTFDFWFPGGGSGVGIFFALSGYLTAGRLFDEPHFDARHAGTFLVRRAIRIYPAYLVVMAAIGAVVFIWANDRFDDFVSALPGILLFWRPASWEPFGIGIGIIWTLFVEVQYYLLMALLMATFGRVRGLILLCAILFISSPLSCLMGISSARGEGVFYYGSAMAAGSLLAFVEHRHRRMFDPAMRKIGWPLGLAILIVLLFLPQMNAVVWWLELNIAALATCGMLAAMIAKPEWPAIPGFAWVGRLAYCLYLVHGPVIDWMRPILGLSMWGKIILFVPITFGLSLALQRFVEQPWIRIGNHWATKVNRRSGETQSSA